MTIKTRAGVWSGSAKQADAEHGRERNVPLSSEWVFCPGQPSEHSAQTGVRHQRRVLVCMKAKTHPPHFYRAFIGPVNREAS
jgi:hypothetical protein